MLRDKEIINKSYLDWALAEDTGTSSKVILSHLTGTRRSRSSTPSDPSDFGRCYRLLKKFPELEERIDELKDIDYAYIIDGKRSYPWVAFVDNYAELCRLWEEESSNGSCPELYKFMKDIGL